MFRKWEVMTKLKFKINKSKKMIVVLNTKRRPISISQPLKLHLREIKIRMRHLSMMSLMVKVSSVIMIQVSRKYSLVLKTLFNFTLSIKMKMRDRRIVDKIKIIRMIKQA